MWRSFLKREVPWKAMGQLNPAARRHGRGIASCTVCTTNVVATDLNRQLGPLLDAGGLVLEHEEPVLFGGLFKVALAHKP